MEFEKLKQIVSEVMGVDAEEVTMETAFVENLGADSLDFYQMIIGIEDEFDIELPKDNIKSIVTVADALVTLKSVLYSCS